jgi:hypothetical protein
MSNEQKLIESEEAKIFAKCWVIDKESNPILLDYIPASCLNVGSGEMVLEWPLWWKCRGCSYSELKHAVPCCTLVKCQFENTNRFLIAATLVRVCIEENNTEYVAKVDWIKEQEGCCHLGITFPA